MHLSKRQWFIKGIKDGIPVMLGYFAVAIALGIAARNARLTAFQASLTSFMLIASAGESVAFTLMAADVGYIEIFLMEAIANARYMLMSCALSQKMDERTPFIHRLCIGYFITDEIFGLSVSVDGMLEPCYTYGISLISISGWVLGTIVGVLLGNVLPVRVVSALSVGLYGMFISIFVPPTKKDRVILWLVIISFAASYFVNMLSIFAALSAGTKIILLTLVISLGAAILFPIREEAKA